MSTFGSQISRSRKRKMQHMKGDTRPKKQKHNEHNSFNPIPLICVPSKPNSDNINPFGHVQNAKNVSSNNPHQFEHHLNYFIAMKQENEQIKVTNAQLNDALNKSNIEKGFAVKQLNKDLNAEKKNNKKLEIQNEDLQTEIDGLEDLLESKTKQVNACYGNSEDVDTMDLSELHKLETHLQSGINRIKKAQKLLSECCCCYANRPNIVFIDGCDHCTVCEQCEKNMVGKHCPRCNVPYTNVKIINFG